MSLPYTIDNHFTFGYNGIPFAEKKNYETDKNNEKKNHEYEFYKKTIKLK